jgi:hypothetical protein
MLEEKKRIKIIIGAKSEFSHTDINSIAQSLNKSTDVGQWDVAVQRIAYAKSTHLSLFLNDSDSHPTY